MLFRPWRVAIPIWHFILDGPPGSALSYIIPQKELSLCIRSHQYCNIGLLRSRHGSWTVPRRCAKELLDLTGSWFRVKLSGRLEGRY